MQFSFLKWLKMLKIAIISICITWRHAPNYIFIKVNTVCKNSSATAILCRVSKSDIFFCTCHQVCTCFHTLSISWDVSRQRILSKSVFNIKSYLPNVLYWHLFEPHLYNCIVFENIISQKLHYILQCEIIWQIRHCFPWTEYSESKMACALFHYIWKR